MKNTFLVLSLLIMGLNAGAQVGIGTTTPDPSAALDINSTEKGLLIPRLTTAQRTAITNPAGGLMVFDSDLNKFCYFEGGNWVALDSSPDAFIYDATGNAIRSNNTVGNIATTDFIFGSTQLDDSGNFDEDQRFFFDKSKAAFRAGRATSNQWDSGIVGSESAAFGWNTIAGDGSFAAGYRANASGEASFAVNEETNATGDGSSAFGDRTSATGRYSTTFGILNTSNSYAETRFGLFSIDNTAISPFTWVADDRLFSVGNGTDAGNRSDALVILKNGNTFINGTLTIDNNFTFPSSDGTNGQTLITDGNGQVSWITQDLSLSGNSLSLSNDATPVDLSVYDQDLSLSGNALSLTNDATPVNLSAYLDNTDAQTLILNGSDLSITNGNVVTLPQEPNIYQTNGTIANERLLGFSGPQILTLQRTDNSVAQSLAFRNSGSFYTSVIATPANGDGNDGGLDFFTKNSGTIQSLESTMRLTDNGTLTLSEYGQGNVNGTAATMLGATTSGEVVEVSASDRIAYTFDQTEQVVQGGSVSGWLRVSDYTTALNVTNGSIVNVTITFSTEIRGGSGNDELRFRVLADGVGCNDVTGGVTDDLEVYRNVRDHSVQSTVQHTFVLNCNGTYQFALEADFGAVNDEVNIDNVNISAIKF